MLALLEQTVKSEFTDFTAHSSLSEVRDSGLVVFDSIGRLFWVKNLDIQDTIDVKRDVIFRYCNLGANLYYLLAQIMDIRDFFNHRDDEIKTWLHLAIVLLETMDQSCKFLAHDNKEAKVMHPTCQSCAAFLSLIEESAIWSGCNIFS